MEEKVLNRVQGLDDKYGRGVEGTLSAGLFVVGGNEKALYQPPVAFIPSDPAWVRGGPSVCCFMFY